MIDITRTPFPVTYRELWLPRAINGNASLPSSRYNGHGLTLTGARLGSTCGGVHFDGSATSNINCGAIHNAATKLWISLRFKFDQDYAAGSGYQYLWGKWISSNDHIYLRFSDANGQLYFTHVVGGATVFNLVAQDGGANITSWEAGRWYHLLASMSDDGATQVNARLIIDNGTVVTGADAARNPIPNGGDFIIGDYDDPGGGAGFKGTIADVVVGTDDLTTTEEAELYKGIPPADAVNIYLLDEGRGTTAYDRGTGGNNGTLDSSATWKFGQVEQPVLSLDGINDHAQSSSGVDISGDLTLVWVGKMKSTYNSLAANHYLAHLLADVDNELRIYYDSVADALRFHAEGAGTAQTVDYSTKPNIDDYLVLVLSLTGADALSAYVNGSLVGSASGVGGVIGSAATAYLGCESTPSLYDISKPLFVALIDGTFSEKQSLIYSRWLKDVFNLPTPV